MPARSHENEYKSLSGLLVGMVRICPLEAIPYPETRRQDVDVCFRVLNMFWSTQSAPKRGRVL